MKFLAALMLLVAFSVQANDKTEKECEAAVDSADSMNVNQPDCDYSDKGLNGFLQKAFKKGEEGAVLETGSPAREVDGAAVAANPSALQKSKVTDNSGDKNFTLSAAVDQWSSVPAVRLRLLPKALEKCGEGFAITGEHYRSLAMGRIELSLQFECD
ncbi:MAG: hypothetical protein B0W54_08680 [Cellvibrio sp. 79]|nr:MAG: hypothetical protein B0W54_08680 [Cellvibrio sp. 79]